MVRKNQKKIDLALRLAYIALLILLLVFFTSRFIDSLLREPTYRLEEFRGGYTIGFRYAYVGGWMITLSQLYVVLKYVVGGFRIKIKLATWLDLHCILNATGFTLVIIHSGFPYQFRYWEPFTKVNLLEGLYGLIGVRGLLTWLVIILFTTGCLNRYGKNIKLKSITHKIHFYTAPIAYLLAVIHITLSILFPTG
ncbi:MAG: hypothetical protein QXK95_00305 [Nitrososphaerota archaeon]|nr:hypothetical protein [Candidatus Geocrenenecus dongiae]